MAAAQHDYYEVLGLERGADDKAIKSAFRQLAKRYHPDQNRDPDAEERFKTILEAYAVLSDPEKKAKYDRLGFAGVSGFSKQDLFGGINFQDILSGLGLDGGFGGLFDRIFGRRRSSATPARGANVSVKLSISLERVATGGEETVRLSHPQICASCQGSGAAAGSEPRPCAACAGTGSKVVNRQDEGVSIQCVLRCSDCEGRGNYIDKPCPTCQGGGRVEIEELLKVKIPVGINEGSVLRVSGHGLASAEKGGAPGDLLMVVHSQPDPRFERRGSDLYHSKTIDVVDAVLGTQFELSGLEGPIPVTLPPGIQPDAVVRICGRGLPHFGAPGQGDLWVTVHVRVPDQLSDEERKLYLRLRELKTPSTLPSQ